MISGRSSMDAKQMRCLTIALLVSLSGARARPNFHRADGTKGENGAPGTSDFTKDTMDGNVADAPGFKFSCPQTYREVVRDKAVFCIPMSAEEITKVQNEQAKQPCAGEKRLVQMTAGAECLMPPPSLYMALTCSEGNVITRDEYGDDICISLRDATERCGQGYTAVPTAHQQYVCKQTRMDLQCPEGFVLRLTNDLPTCVSESEPMCLDVTAWSTGGCLGNAIPELPHCDDGYEVKVSPDGPGCFMSATPMDVDLHASQDIGPCGGTDAVRLCDLDTEVLLAGCNPDCANGGTCLDGVCVCPQGVTGSACHLDVDECRTLAQPVCDHACVNTFGSYYCDCPAGYALTSDGVSCTVKECVPACLNNGECRYGQCHCPAGWDGDHCQKDIDECRSTRRLCEHQCRKTYGGYQCLCPPGSRLNADGKTCTSLICVPRCRNGGRCANSKCFCPTGFRGIICQFDINECYTRKPCHHVCINTWGSYRCGCNNGYVLSRDGHTCISAQF